MPIRSAGHSGTVGVLRLMTAHAIQSGHAFAGRTANNIREMAVPIVALAIALLVVLGLWMPLSLSDAIGSAAAVLAG